MEIIKRMLLFPIIMSEEVLKTIKTKLRIKCSKMRSLYCDLKIKRHDLYRAVGAVCARWNAWRAERVVCSIRRQIKKHRASGGTMVEYIWGEE